MDTKILLEARSATKKFGGLTAVNAVDMQINKGDIFGIIGPNGAGKTTFFNMCTGFYTLDKGNIFLEGQDITNQPSDVIAHKGIARTFQNIKLFKYMTVLDNISIGSHINTKTSIIDAVFHTDTYKKDEEYIKETGMEILHQVGLEKYSDSLAGNLPYGVQRKVEIARALAVKPKILLLDEPAAGMNPIETDSLMSFIKMLNSMGYTIALIEHDMKFVMNSCNRIIVLNFGEKIFEGTPEEVKNSVLVQEAYFGKGIAVSRGLSA
ncbi:ABC transporter ATP-binding protein [Oribacterium sp. WCC10]|uniref:ABC transporter ATP-binding protein n=1 Tax=Oribacterium sp. WCC10 TaxID=1855343 RepID=UPI0008E29F07|nr:ABC transporter ATP-binding protein [Oribacterium sp. WCC10]SFG62461.1 amino acid/amide ABC transporter ATP-binding protein 1, HAAT family [Oribacterium sp. WCC10]